MEREELRSKVDESLESSQVTLTLSDETINGELDDALEGITEDAQVDDKYVAKIAGRLKRMDGNLHKDVSTQVKIYKKAHPAPKITKPEEEPKDGDNEGKDWDKAPAWAKAMKADVEAMKQTHKAESEKQANDAVVETVRKGLKAKFKSAGVEGNDYILRQTLRDIVIPETEEGESVDTDELTKKTEKLYYKNLKEAGLAGSQASPRRGGTSSPTGKTAADRFFKKKGKREGWGGKE